MQFQPKSKKKLRRVCLHPGRGESRGFSSVDGVWDLAQEPRKELKYFRFGRGDRKSMKRGMRSKQLLWPHCRCESGEREDSRHGSCDTSGLLVDQRRRAVHSTSFEPVSSHRQRTMVSRPLIRTDCYASGRRPKMDRPSLLRHETETWSRSRKLNRREFRLNKLSRPTRFRPRKSVYGKRKLRQRQPGFSILSRHPLRFRIRSRK